jgi:cell division protease FtsH
MSQLFPSGSSYRPPQSDPNAKPPAWWVPLLVALGAMLLVWSSFHSISGVTKEPEVAYSEFYTLVQQEKVKSVVLELQQAKVELKSPQKIDGHDVSRLVTTIPTRDDALLPLLRDKGVETNIVAERTSWVEGLIVTLLPWMLIIGIWLWLGQRARRAMSGGPLGFLRGKSHKFERTQNTAVKFADVAGLKGAKRDLQEVVGFLKEPDRFRRLGGKVPRGVLLIGPPGTGKTLLARAVAGESHVPFFSITASEFIELFVGVGAARVRDLFQEAKSGAPSIIFIDEIDAVGRARGAGLGGGHDEREQTLNQLLSEMDGFSRNDLTIVMAATNRPDVLDPALLRPGRFDRRVVVDRPELDARRAILGVHSKNKPLANDVDIEAIARSTPGFSGADLENLVNEAALAATRRGADVIESRDFAEAQDKIILGDLRESKLDPEEKRRVAVHESGHAVVAHFTPQAEPLRRVSIIPRGLSLGATQQVPAADRHLMTAAELGARLTVLMGGHAAERAVLGDISSGSENDLKEATRIATRMMANYGMSKKLGAVFYEHDNEHPFLGQRIATESGTSDATVATIEAEARNELSRALDRALDIINTHRPQMDRLIATLLEKEVAERTDLESILGAPTGASGTRPSNGDAACPDGVSPQSAEAPQLGDQA